MIYGYAYDTSSTLAYALSILPILGIGLIVTLKAALAGFAIYLVELERASRIARGIDFHRETDQRNGDLSGPVRACHRTIWMQRKPSAAQNLEFLTPFGSLFRYACARSSVG